MDYWVKRTFASHIWIWNFRKKHNSADWRYFPDGKSTTEIHHKIEKEEDMSAQTTSPKVVSSFNATVLQIILLDIVFSFDSILTAVGLTPHVIIMIIAVIISMMIMMAFAGPVSNFINKHPSLQILALSFLILIGVTLILEGMPEGLGIHVPKGYIYFAIFFSLAIELLNMRFRTKIRKYNNLPLHQCCIFNRI